MDEESVSEPDFWERRYRDGRDGWDIGVAAPPFVDLLAGPDAPAPGRLIALGAGRGYDALLFAEHGFDVVGVDFAAPAVAAARRAAAGRALRGTARFEQRDMFALPEEYGGSFDYVLEHTCLSAIDPGRRDQYARLVHRLLRPGGLYIALFFDHGRGGGPPFTINSRGIHAMFAGLMEVERLGRPTRHHPQRQGQELFGLLRKK